MPRRSVLLCLVLLCLICVCTVGLGAQDLENLQIHGFATQGFLFSSNNNYLTMRSSVGSLQWTEGAVSVTDPVTDKLRIGMQLHMYQIGDFGGPNIVVDWASGDYRVNDQFGVRAGKVKVPLGLFNDCQDVDGVYLWILLPQAMYPIDNRNYDLTVLGGEAYGVIGLGARAGRLQYGGYAGGSKLDANGGYAKQLEQIGLSFTDPPGGTVIGGDVRWMTPLRGLMVGASTEENTLDGTAPEGTVHLIPAVMNAYYAQWNRGRFHFAAEYWRVPVSLMLTVEGTPVPMSVDQRAWYPMASFQVTKKMQVGGYYSHYLNKAGDTSQPENYSKDWVMSGRYDFNEYFYGKVEGHFLHGTGLGYYASSNPNGLQTNANMLAARIGFSF
jgi:hypothetical protein